MRPLTPAIAFSLLLSGCAAADLAGMSAGGGDVDPVRGQTILFVGTDPSTLSKNIYQVQAISQDDFATDEERNAAVLFAEGFELTVLTDLSVDSDGDGPLTNDSDTLLPAEAPFAVPDRLGNRVGIIVSSYDDEDDLPVGRAAVVDLATGTQFVAPDVPGLTGVRFSWLGQYLLLEHWDADTGAIGLSRLDLNAIAPEVEPLEVPDAFDVFLTGLIPDSDAFYATAVDTYGASSLLRVDAATGTVDTLVQAVTGGLSDLTVSPDGALAAATLVDSETGRGGVVVADLTGQASWTPLTNELGADCQQPAWNPAPLGSHQLVYVCEDLSTGRPDVYLWQGDGPPQTSSPPMDSLTGGAQPSVPEGSMDGLVLRSRLRWDPTGSVLLFGASSASDAAIDAPMSLLVLDPAERRAVPVYDGDNGVADLVHFAAASSDPVLLVWDISTLGTEDSVGRHPIQLVAADPLGPRTVRGVDLGRDLIVEYPLFLGGNTLLYP